MDTTSAAEVIEKHLAEAMVVQPTVAELTELSISVELTYCEPTSNSALRLDLDSQVSVGRLTWWSDGSFYSEALRASDGANFLSRHGTAATAGDAVDVLRELGGTMAGLPSNNSFKPKPLRGSA